MHLTNALTRSLLLHALLVAFILFQVQKIKTVEIAHPKKWIMDVKIILQERELQLPQPGVKDGKNETPPTVKSSDQAGANNKPAVEEKKSEKSPLSAEATPISKSVPADSDEKKEDRPAVDANEQAMARQMQQAFTAQVNAQFMLMHMNAYFKGARLSTQAFINNGITGENREKLNGKTAFVKLLYKEDGALKSVEVQSDSDELKAILENVSWKAVPQPQAYYLPYRGIGMQIAIQYGRPLIGINVLPEDMK